MPETMISVKRIPQSNAPGADSFFLEVREAVRAMLRPAIILELPATTRLDSLAIDFVIRSAAEAATYDAEVALVATSQEHRLLLDVTRFSSVLPVFGSAAEAVAHLERELRPTLSDNFLDSPTSAA